MAASHPAGILGEDWRTCGTRLRVRPAVTFRKRIPYLSRLLRYEGTLRPCFDTQGPEDGDPAEAWKQPKGVFRAAIKERWPDLEDGFQYYAAKRYAHPIDVLVTNNTKHFKLAQGIGILTPAEFVRKHLK